MNFEATSSMRRRRPPQAGTPAPPPANRIPPNDQEWLHVALFP
jgi:hypothetical protein